MIRREDPAEPRAATTASSGPDESTLRDDLARLGALVRRVPDELLELARLAVLERRVALGGLGRRAVAATAACALLVLTTWVAVSIGVLGLAGCAAYALDVPLWAGALVASAATLAGLALCCTCAWRWYARRARARLALKLAESAST